MTRKDKQKNRAKKQETLQLAGKPSRPPSGKKQKRQQARAEQRDKQPAQSEPPRAKGRKSRSKKRHEQRAEAAPKLASVPPPPVAPTLDTDVLPHVGLSDSYELTADGEDFEALSADAPELGIGSRVVAPHVRFEDDALESYRPAPVEDGNVEDQIRALEARLDGLIQGAARTDPAAQASAVAVAKASTLGDIEPESSAEAIAVESAAELAGSHYYVQKWGRKGLRSRAEEVDEFGLDRSFDAKLRPLLDFVYRRYFRIQTEGIVNVPGEGRAVVVGNHSGSIPIDGLMLRTALRVDHPQGRDLRWLAEDFLFYLPFAGVAMNRAGAVRACQENAERLLSRDNLIAVFPEGVQGIRKLFRDRYRLQRFGRGGYIRLCLRTRAPLIPCAIIGGEESSPLLYRFDALADLLRIPYLPVTPTFPALGALGLLPAPTKWRIRFGEPIPFDNYGPEAADDDVLVGRLSDRVRAAIQSMLDHGLQKRRSIWF
ncbi:MAG TPA: lysophospholipid acyltransferase family protein [Polyangiaceae bacterium]|nr:lysophospholipid acyltransferase family protein [Polyangiaceae bacterium]